jgi:ABC-type Zn uptake system ZnuABC Zn-binding protein ZnuA
LLLRTVRKKERVVIRRLVVLVAGLALAWSVGACGDADGDVTTSDGVEDPALGSADLADELVVVTTVSPITNLAAAVIGEHATIRGVVPEGADSHTFEPPPSAVAALADADVVLLNGMELEASILELARANTEDDAIVVELGSATLTEDEWRYDRSYPEAEGKPNPHLWTHPRLAADYADHIAATMSDADPEHADEYATNADAFRAKAEQLDEAMRTSFATVPPEHRKLLTYHDAFAYVGDDYGWEVIGAIQMSNADEPTPREVAQLIDQVREEEVPAIFGSEVFPSPVLELIGREAGVRYIDVLRDDDLPGEPGDPDHSLLGLLRFDYVTITEAMGGDASALHSFDVRLSVPDRAHYPQ